MPSGYDTLNDAPFWQNGEASKNLRDGFALSLRHYYDTIISDKNTLSDAQFQDRWGSVAWTGDFSKDSSGKYIYNNNQNSAAYALNGAWHSPMVDAHRAYMEYQQGKPSALDTAMSSAGFKPGMSAEDFYKMMESKYPGFAKIARNGDVEQAISGAQRILGTGGTQDPGGAGDGSGGQSQDDQYYNDSMARLQKFSDSLLSLDPNDPYARQLKDATNYNAAKNAYGRGMDNSGLSEQNREFTSTQALAGYQLQRQQLGEATIGQMQQGALAHRGQDLGMQQFNANLQFQVAQANEQNSRLAYIQQANQGQGVGSLVGGTLGGIAGGLVSYGNPMAISAGAALGSGIGRGLGGMSQAPYQPSYYSGSYGSGRNSYGSGNGRGGGY